ncbi:MAG: NAD-dependent epimerase/dehydratase family protein [Verrucomicrobiaceae bacterium]|nr:NAD-dependent epimerase/dehydratase family protein [Verrucomicrobiaceae bacterium]
MTPQILILGGGAVTEHLHLPALARLGWLANTRVADLNAMALKHLQTLYPDTQVSALGFAEALEAGCADFAVITLPNHLHEAACMAALEARVPVLCEKPLALGADVCARLDEAFHSAGLALGVGMSRRFTHAFRAMRTAIKAGTIGEVESVRVSHGGLYEWPSSTGEAFRPANGGVLADMGVHFLDLLQLLLGKLEIVGYADDWAGGVEAECEMKLRSLQGVPASMRLSRRRVLANEFVVQGTRGSLTMKAADFTRCTLQVGSEVSGQISLGGEADFVDAFVEQYQQWSQGLKGSAHDVSSAGEHGEVIALVQHAYAQRPAPERQPAPELRGRIAITGATGFIGTRLVERLGVKEGVELRCLLRSYRRAAGIGCYPVEMTRVGLEDRAELEAAFRGCRFVVHLAYGNDGEINAQKRTTIDGTQAVVEAAIAAGVEAVVVLSTLWVYGFPESAVELDESAPYRPHGGAYAESKAAMEQWCLERAKTSGSTRLVILNPGNVYGPWGYAYTRLPLDLATEGTFAFVENGEGLCHYNHVDNLVDAITASCLTTAAHGQRFIIADGRCTWREFLTPLLDEQVAAIQSMSKAELAAQEPPPGRLVDVVRAALGSAEVRRAAGSVPMIRSLRNLARRVLPARPAVSRPAPAARPSTASAHKPVPAWLADLYPLTSTRFTAAKAERVLGWRPQVTLAEGLAQGRAWWLESQSND